MFRRTIPLYIAGFRTHSACTTVQSLPKIVLFGALGVTVPADPTLLAATAAAACLGTLTGKTVLAGLPEQLYHVLLHTAMLAGEVFIVVKAVWCGEAPEYCICRSILAKLNLFPGGWLMLSTITAILVVGVVWWLAEYESPTSAIVVLAIFATFGVFSIETRLVRIGKQINELQKPPEEEF